MKRILVLTAIALILASSAATAGEALKKKIDALVAAQRGRMRVGVSIVHIQGGQRVEVDGRSPYPLASVFKLPIMIELARQMQEGRKGVSLDRLLTVTEQEKCIGSGTLQHSRNGTKVSVRRCVELMETISDNTATDMIFNLVGTASVNRMMHGLGLRSADIDLTNRAAYLIALGMGSQFRGLSARQIADRWKGLDEAQKQAAVERILRENRGLTLARFQAVEDASAARQTGQQYVDDVYLAAAVDNLASPADMADLCAMLFSGRILDARWTQYCLGVLSRQQFNTRIPRFLPAGTRTWHKTGTIAGIVNDAGIVQIAPGNAFAVAVLIRDIREGRRGDAEVLIGRITKAAYDAFQRR